MTGNEMKMPVKATPFDHQRRAFQFVLWLFGMTDGRVRSTGAAQGRAWWGLQSAAISIL